MILYELLVDAAIAGAVAATAGTGSGGAGAAYGIRTINLAKKLENIKPFGKQAAKLVEGLQPQIEQTLKLISEGGGGKKKLKDCRGDIRSPKQKAGSGNGGSLKNKMGELDEAARRARTDPVHGSPDVPEAKVDAPDRPSPPEIPAGSKGRQGAGKKIPQSLRDEHFPQGQTRPPCAYCRQEPSTDLDHVLPRAKGGDLTPENITPACKHCNTSKGARECPKTPPSNYQGSWPPPWWPQWMKDAWQQRYGN